MSPVLAAGGKLTVSGLIYAGASLPNGTGSGSEGSNAGERSHRMHRNHHRRRGTRTNPGERVAGIWKPPSSIALRSDAKDQRFHPTSTNSWLLTESSAPETVFNHIGERKKSRGSPAENL